MNAAQVDNLDVIALAILLLFLLNLTLYLIVCKHIQKGEIYGAKTQCVVADVGSAQCQLREMVLPDSAVDYFERRFAGKPEFMQKRLADGCGYPLAEQTVWPPKGEKSNHR